MSDRDDTLFTVNAPSGADIYDQGDLAGHHSYNSMVRLQYQTGGNAARNGYLLDAFTAGSAGNVPEDSRLALLTSDDDAKPRVINLVLE